MRTRLLAALFGACASVMIGDRAIAHGGMYRGPPDVVPPAPGGGGGPGGPSGPGGPTTGHPGTPSAPAPSGPSTGRPGGPTGGGGGGGGVPGARTGGAGLEPDLTTWDLWWEFNKDSYLQLKGAVHRGVSTGGDDYYLGRGRAAADTQKPTRNQIRDDVLPALVRAISSTDNRDIQSSCLIALAKIGEDLPDAKLAEIFGKRLQRRDQEIRETAALSFGIAGRVDNGALEVLTSLALDDAAGRAASADRDVNTRTRAFALYGLGLLAWEHTDLTVKRSVLATMRKVLADDNLASRDLKVAAIHGIGLLNVGATTADDAALQRDALAALVQYYDRDLGAGSKLIQSHCPTAIARLLRNDTAAAEPFKARFAEDLQGKDKSHKDNADIARSCVLALGQLCAPCDDDRSKDARYSKLLLETYRGHRDMQTRWFAALALGQIGGRSNQFELIDLLKKGKALEKPWCALALGVLSHDLYTAQEAASGGFEQDRDIGNALAAQFADANEPSLRSALAIGLGLNRHKDAAGAMTALLRSESHKEDQAGYLCIGLGLMHEDRAIDAINGAMDTAGRRATLLERSAIALGLLGDKKAAEKLVERLGDEKTNLATFAAYATALGQIGDRRTIDPLKRMLFDEGRGELVRAFAAVSLGGIADRAPLPWYAKIAANVNYRAAVETLTNQNSGILDLL